jgi:DNA invertase Pin-like site-specific DNA recombinase
MKFAYIRVSTAEQNTARQLEGLPTVDRIFEEKISGKNADRPQLQAMLGTLRAGDEVFVHDMTRLGRSMIDLVNLTEQIVEAGCSVHFVKERMTFDGTNKDDPFLKLQRNLLASFAEFERGINKQRQREGIAIAKQQGVYKGGTKKLSDADAEKLRKDWIDGLSVKLLMAKYNIKRASVYNYTKGCRPPEQLRGRAANRPALIEGMAAE